MYLLDNSISFVKRIKEHIFALTMRIYPIFYLNLALTMNEFPNCPNCNGENTYFDGSLYVCPDCSNEFLPTSAEAAIEEDTTPRDSNGTELMDGDAVTVIKDLKVKGSSMVIKRGTKVKSIRLTDVPEQVDCKIDGSSIVLKTCFLKK